MINFLKATSVRFFREDLFSGNHTLENDFNDVFRVSDFFLSQFMYEQ